ncbi:hypothetical protein L1281_002513 [Neisseria sp. HSC-16F19]|nr:hypothetical protein [Neisseria sp. HSC-16F19]MCP2041895.1 hypothetical protein [Neisseria sp. HSC-16F19]
MELSDWSITIRYDGIDAEKHAVELDSLGESLRGFAKVIATAAHFAATQQYNKRSDAQTVRVCAQATRANCFSVDTVLDFVRQNQLLSGSFGVMMAALLPYIFHRNAQNKQEMKHLKEALSEAIAQLGNRDQETSLALIALIDKMAGDLRPSVRQAVAPIGESCERISIVQDGKNTGTINQNDKAEIDRLADNELTGIQEFTVQISELDKVRKTAKVNLAGSDPKDRIAAEIFDPQISNPDNPYIRAFSSGETVTIQAKASTKDGAIKRLHIFDIA